MQSASLLLDVTPFQTPAESLGDLAADAAAHLLAAAGDIALVIDAEGIVRDVALGNANLKRDGFLQWVGRRWVDTVTLDSRKKIEQMLGDARRGAPARWRQVNHPVGNGAAGGGPDFHAGVPIRYLSVGAGKTGRIVAVGRDLRATAALQQRLLEAQQSMERDYVKLRQAETRYRQLFDVSSEAVLIVDGATRRITEANPAAAALTGTAVATLNGRPFAAIVDAGSRDAAVAMLGAVAASGETQPVAVRLAGKGEECALSATLFRKERGASFLVRLVSSPPAAGSGADPARVLAESLERIPDPFVLTDEDLVIIAQNGAFLDLTQSPRAGQVTGQPLGTFLGRPGIDLGLLAAQLREHGVVRNFATVVRGRGDAQEDVEISAVAAPLDGKSCFGISVRGVGRLLPASAPDMPRSVEQLTKLVGRVSLKEIVRESSDLIERLCIEAALELTADNRASAAELLGLSRQSLYSKLHRHGLAVGMVEAEPLP